MGTIISAIYDDIKLHGSVEAAQAWREREEVLYFPDPEEVVREPEWRDGESVVTSSDFKRKLSIIFQKT
jgi:hypothetical protein